MHKPPMTTNAVAADTGRLARHFEGGSDLLPLWIAEPYVPLAPEVVAAVERRAAADWYGYESRPAAVIQRQRTAQKPHAEGCAAASGMTG